MLRRILPVIAAATAVTLMPVGSALAHDDDISATCEGLSVELFNYSAEAPNVNTVQIWVDGIVVAGPTTFGSTFSHSEPFADPTMDHTWRVAVTATMFPEATFDRQDTVEGCPAPTTTTTMAPTTTTTMAPTTTTTMAPTTTTMAPTTTSTTAVASAGGVGTTTLVAPVVAPSPPAPAAASPASATLPATGAEQNNIALVALGVLLIGGLLTAVAVRSRPRT